MEDGVTAAESMEGESAWGSDGGGATEDAGVGVFDGEGEIIRLPPPMNGAGEGDWAIAEAISRQVRIRNPRTFEIDISSVWEKRKGFELEIVDDDCVIFVATLVMKARYV